MTMIDQMLLAKVINQESGGNPNAVSPAGAQGIMQIMPDTARNPGYGIKPLEGWDGVNPMTAPVEEQLRFGTDYLNAMANKFGSKELALAAYNAGPGAVEQYNGIPPYQETQSYVNNIMGNYNKEVKPMATQNDWRSRATAVNAQPTQQPIQQPINDTQIQIPQPILNTVTPVSDWKSRALAVNAQQPQPQSTGEDIGRTSAVVQGFNSAIPFGERIAAGLGSGMAYAYDQVAGEGDTSLSEFYKTGRANQKATREEHPGYYTGGAITGIAATLPAASAKVIGAAPAATTGVRGMVNQIPQALQATGKYIKGAQGAGLVGQGVRSASVAIPTGAAYSYGASNNDLDSAGAVKDAKDGAIISGMLGAALPAAGAVANSIIKPAVSDGVKKLAQLAESHGIKLSLDQIAPTRVRSTVQKMSQNIPGSGVDKFQEAQKMQWNKAVAKQLGMDAPNLGPEVIQKYLDKAGKEFDSALTGKTISFTQKDINAIADIAENSRTKISAGLADIVQKNVDSVLKNLSKFQVGKTRSVPGKSLASLRSQLLADIPSIEAGAKAQVGNIIEKIDDIIERHLTPEQVRTLGKARLEWRNYRTLEPLLEKSTDGLIEPNQLMQRVASSKYIKSSRKITGEDNLIDLARIGKQFLTKKGGSDTAPNLLIGSGVLGNATLAATAPQLAIPAMLAQGGVVGGNIAYQKLNQSQSLVKKAISDAAPNLSKLPIANMLLGNTISKFNGE